MACRRLERSYSSRRGWSSSAENIVGGQRKSSKKHTAAPTYHVDYIKQDGATSAIPAPDPSMEPALAMES